MTESTGGAPRAGGLSRRRLLRTGVGASVGLAAWHAPELALYDLRGSRALAASSGPLIRNVTATSVSRTRGGRTFQHWNNARYTLPFPSGTVEVRVRRRATARNLAGTNANGIWDLITTTVPTGCTSCEVTNITMTCPIGTSDITGVPGTTGNVHCNNSPPDVTTAVTATFTVTCT